MAYKYYRTITIDHTKVPSTQTDFPVLVSLTDATLKTVGNGGHVENSNGYDIIFSTTSSSANKINHEIESYDATTGKIVFWTKVSSLSSSSDTVIYVLYGDPTITTSQENKTGVWDSNFYAVYHLKTVSSLVDRTDSTSNARDLTKNGGEPNTVSLTINGGNNIDGGMTCTSAAGLKNASFGNPGFPFTISFWLNPNSTQVDLIRINTASTNNDGHRVSIISSGGSNKFVEWVRSAITVYDFNNAAMLFSNTATVYCVVQVDAGGSAKVYVGAAGSINSQTIAASTTINGTPNNIFIGETAGPDIDEVRVSTSTRSADWVTTEYNNQYAPGTFLTLGAEQVNNDFQSVGDSISLTDGASLFVSNELPVVADAISLTDDIALQVSFELGIGDAVSLSDSPAAFAQVFAETGDALSFTDAVNLFMALSYLVGDSISLSDGLSPVTNSTIVEIGDDINLVDEALLFMGLFMAIGDALNLTDQVTALLGLGFEVGDSLNLTDHADILVVGITPLTVAVGDALSLSDSLFMNGPANMTLVDYFRRYLNDVQR